MRIRMRIWSHATCPVLAMIHVKYTNGITHLRNLASIKHSTLSRQSTYRVVIAFGSV